MKTNGTRAQGNSKEAAAHSRDFFSLRQRAPFELSINLEIFKKRKQEQAKKRINKNKGRKSSEGALALGLMYTSR